MSPSIVSVGVFALLSLRFEVQTSIRNKKTVTTKGEQPEMQKDLAGQ
jgi:hypothetical protein